jgi:hypothetical protein
MDNITPKYVRNLAGYTEHFLCNITENIYNIRFIKFRVRDLESETVLFEVEEEKTEEGHSDTGFRGKQTDQV